MVNIVSRLSIWMGGVTITLPIQERQHLSQRLDGDLGSVEIEGLRDRAILSVGLQVGLRRAEIAALMMAHGDPFDGLPVGGLLELVRDLIGYAYRDVIQSA
jgi:hypothetical protein